MDKNKKIIGFYNYTVILTYLSLISGIFAMIFSTRGHWWITIACIGLSGLFDMFDGRVARKKSNRSHNEQMFGIQLDSLCDMVAFGATPVVVCFNMGMDNPVEIAILIFYCLCGVIRLAYFNVLETNDLVYKTESKKVYHGLPITSISIFLPIVFLTSYFLTSWEYELVLDAVMLIVAILFVTNFTIKKPSNAKMAVIVVVITLLIAAALLLGHSNISIGQI